MNKKLKLDLGCGNRKQTGHIGVDITKTDTQADIEWDLFKKFPWPWDINSVDVIYCSHVIEHIPHGDGFHDPFWDFFNELYRVLKVGGTAEFLCPYYSSIRAFQDPTHQRMIGETSYVYLNHEWRKTNKLLHYPVQTNFEILKMAHSIPDEYLGKSQETIQYAVSHYWNAASDLNVILKKHEIPTV